MPALRPLQALLVGAALLAAGPALAHTGVTATSGFQAGALHPIAGFDHLLAMVAVGMLGTLIGGAAMLAVPASFVLSMAAGAALGAAGVALPLVEPAILMSVLVLGLVVAAGWRMTLPAACALAAGFALFHGHAHGAEMPADTSGLAYGLGFVSGTALMHVAGIGFAAAALSAMPGRGRLLVRAGGGTIAALGLALAVL